MKTGTSFPFGDTAIFIHGPSSAPYRLQYSDGSPKFAATTKSSETKDAQEDIIDTKLM
jgi:hypothetical protein